MLKTISSIINAIGALNYKGTWDANANSPALASSVGTKGDYYVVGTAGSTNLNGISNWGVGDWAAFNGSVWQRVEGGANLNGVDLSVSGTSTLSGLTASTALALNASKEIVSVTNTGTGNNVLATTPTLVGDVSLSTGNLVIGTAGKGIDFSVDPSAPGMTSELLDDYEEGTWTPVYSAGAATFTYPSYKYGKYTKVGNMVTVFARIATNSIASGSAGNLVYVGGLPFANAADSQLGFSLMFASGFNLNTPSASFLNLSATEMLLHYRALSTSGVAATTYADLVNGSDKNDISFQFSYTV